MKIAIVTESFLPLMNGVTHSLLRVLDHLAERGDEAIVITPRSPGSDAPSEVAGAKVFSVPSFALPSYSQVRLAPGSLTRPRRLLADFAPDVVHLASPFVLGWRAVQAANELGLPTVAIYQTEVPAYAARYGIPHVENMLWSRVRNIHQRASLTLAPSTYACRQLTEHGVENVKLWARGVDSTRFMPGHRDEAWRREHDLGDPNIRYIGYVGRLAAEKQVQDLVAISGIPGTRLVIVGEGPERARLQSLLPDALFTGFLGGDDLARVVASFDLFVHPGESETFCQTIQEAMASGLPVIAPARGGPLDLVDPSRTGWLYRPGDLTGLRAHALDLIGDDHKRRAFGDAARATVIGRTWKSVCSQLIGHYSEAIEHPEPAVMSGRRR